MPAPLSANTFSRSFLSSQHMIGRAKNYTDTGWKEFKRCIAAMFSFGGSEIWHAKHAEEVEAAFVTAAKDILDAELTGDENEKKLTIATPAGPLIIIQRSDIEGLDATLNGEAIVTHEFTSIKQLRSAIRTNLNNNPDVANHYLSTKEKLKSCIAPMFSFGGSAIWYAKHVKEVEEAFVTATKDLLDTELTDDDNQKKLEIATPAGPLIIIQRSDTEGLNATLNGEVIGTDEFTSITQLKRAIRTSLDKNPDVANRYLNTKEKIARITMVQAFFRRHNVTEVKEPQAHVTALRLSPTDEHPIGEAIAYNTDGLLQRHRLFPFVAYPKPEAPIKHKGADKTLTHLTPRKYQVKQGDTLSQIAVAMGQSRDNLLKWNNLTSDSDIQVGQDLYVVPRGKKANQHRLAGLTLKDSSVKTTDPELLDVIREHKLDQIKPQIRIDEFHVMADYLGPVDLHHHIFHVRTPYTFDPLHFEALAKNIDKLHSLKFAHRDIKPGNMFFADDHICLTDLDYGGRVGTFPEESGTFMFLTPAFLTDAADDNADHYYSLSAYAKDRYGFLISMMVAYYRDMPIKRTRGLDFLQFTPDQIKEFTQQMPCSKTRQAQLIKFISNPERYLLPAPLAQYFMSSL